MVGFLVAVGHAQVAKDLPPGTPGDAVIRAYGWPKGRSAAANREIWTYEKFQITLEDGRVVDVSAMPPPSKIIPNQRTTTPRLPTRNFPNAPDRAPTITPVPGSKPNTAAPTSNSSRPVTIIRVPASLIQVQSQTRQTPPAGPVAGQIQVAPTTSLFWPVFGSVMVVAGLAIIAVLRRIWVEQLSPPHSSLSTASEPSAVQTRKTWQEEIVERLSEKGLSRPTSSSTVPPAVEFTVELIRKLEWKRYELLVSLYFNATGVRAESTQVGADGGIDIKLYRHGEARAFSYVQCKAWGSELVGVSLVRALFGVMAADKISAGVFATTSSFTPDARTFAIANNISLLTTSDLEERLRRLSPENRASILAQVTAGDYTTPSCPNCDRKMIWKEKAGFWGCPKYPSCRSKPIYPRVRS